MLKVIAVLSIAVALVTFAPQPYSSNSDAIAGLDSAFHLKLVKSDPAADASLESMPEHLQLWFNQNLKMDVTTVQLKHGEMVLKLPAVVAVEDDPKSFTVVVPDSVSRGPGTYAVQWATAGNDDHVVKGSFAFSVGK